MIQRQSLWRNRAGIWSVPKVSCEHFVRIFQCKIREKIYMFKLAFGNKSWHENSNNNSASVVIFPIRKKLQGSFIHWCWAAHQMSCECVHAVWKECLLLHVSGCVCKSTFYFKVFHSGVSCHVSVEMPYYMLGSMNSAASSCMWMKCTTLSQWITGSLCRTGSARSQCREMVTCL